MPNYQKMYAILCGAIDDVIDPLEKIPLAVPSARKLRAALEEAEELYIATSPSLTDDSTAERCANKSTPQMSICPISGTVLRQHSANIEPIFDETRCNVLKRTNTKR